MSKKTVLERYSEMNKTQPTMQWVSVEERYPEVDTVVLVTNGINHFGLAVFNSEQWFIDQQECWEIEGVTHWCKLENAIFDQ